jgi:hypothetical protein
LNGLVEQVARQQRLIEKAKRRGWHLAAQIHQSQLSGIIRAMCDRPRLLRAFVAIVFCYAITKGPGTAFPGPG